MNAVLRLENLVKRYGALVVTDHVSLDLMPGEVHAVIGPNGAGKTTLIGEITGETAPDQGRVLFEGRDLTRMNVAARARLGLARSFQITQVFGGFTVHEAVATAAQAVDGSSFRFWRPASVDTRLNTIARERLAQVGLLDRGDRPVRDLSHGEKRQLEIAMALASNPQVLLLDEPMAGMGRDETDRMIDVLQALKGSVAMLLIEHDMSAVFRLADRVSVLVYGQIVASGTPDAIRANAAVREAYLGSEAVP
jgi:branched-chain amino acid transport system ATP-binding protein